MWRCCYALCAERSNSSLLHGGGVAVGSGGAVGASSGGGMAVKLSTELRREVVTRVVIVPVIIELQLLFVLLSGIPFCSVLF